MPEPTNIRSTIRPAGMTRVAATALYGLPLVVIPLVAQRSLRQSPAFLIVGLTLFAIAFVASAILVRGAIQRSRHFGLDGALGGLFWMMPFALIGLAWIGLGTPWEATAAENQLRYLVLIGSAVLVTLGSGILKDHSHADDKIPFASLAATLMLLAGAAYIVWFAWELGGWVQRAHGMPPEDESRSLNERFDVLLFVACVLSHAGTLVWIAALRVRNSIGSVCLWGLGGLTVTALVFLLLRGLAFPDPNATAEPWYFQPGFVAGIPAMPWLVPHWLGVTLLWRQAAPGGLGSSTTQ